MVKIFKSCLKNPVLSNIYCNSLLIFPFLDISDWVSVNEKVRIQKKYFLSNLRSYFSWYTMFNYGFIVKLWGIPNFILENLLVIFRLTHMWRTRWLWKSVLAMSKSVVKRKSSFEQKFKELYLRTLDIYFLHYLILY